MGRLTRMFIPRPARVVKRAVTHPVSTVVRAATPRPVRQVQRAAWKVANPIDAAQNAAWKAADSALTPRSKKQQRKPAAKRTRQWRFNPPPGWPTPPAGWTPQSGWQPDPSWPPVPPGWKLWIA